MLLIILCPYLFVIDIYHRIAGMSANFHDIAIRTCCFGYVISGRSLLSRLVDAFG